MSRIPRPTTRVASSLALVVTAGVVLSGCGGPTLAGAAAIVDGERIPVSSLQQTTRDLRAADTTGQLPEGESQRAVLGRMIVSRVTDRAARQEGVTVTKGEIDARLAQIEQQLGGRPALTRELVARAIAPSYLQRWARDFVLGEKLQRKLGDETDPQGDAVTQLLIKTGQEMSVRVNPRYGSWDPTQGSIRGSVSGGLSKTAEEIAQLDQK